MLKEFEKYLINRGYKEFSANASKSTVFDYVWRINKICEKEKITLDELSKNIQKYMELYKPGADRWNTISSRSHQSYWNALRNYRKFVLVSRFGGVNG